MERPYALSCHCGAIRLSVDAELTDLEECNCSTCAALRLPALEGAGGGGAPRHPEARALHLSVARRRRRASVLPDCGTALMRTGYRDRIAVNARCIEGIDIFTLKVARYDGRTLMPPGPTL
jgi:hypothetical protein